MFGETLGTFGTLVRSKRVLIVDEVDDTCATLQYVVEKLRRLNAPSAITVMVVHNNLKPKVGTLPEDVAYIAGEHMPNHWNSSTNDGTIWRSSSHTPRCGNP